MPRSTRRPRSQRRVTPPPACRSFAHLSGRKTADDVIVANGIKRRIEPQRWFCLHIVGRRGLRSSERFRRHPSRHECAASKTVAAARPSLADEPIRETQLGNARVQSPARRAKSTNNCNIQSFNRPARIAIRDLSFSCPCPQEMLTLNWTNHGPPGGARGILERDGGASHGVCLVWPRRQNRTPAVASGEGCAAKVPTGLGV